MVTLFLLLYLQIPKQFKSASELQLYGEKIRNRQHAVEWEFKFVDEKVAPSVVPPTHDTSWHWAPKRSSKTKCASYKAKNESNKSIKISSLRPSYIITIKKWRTRISSTEEAYITREAPKPHLSFVHLLIEVPTPRVIWYDRWSRFLITLIWKLSKDALDSIYHLLRLLHPSEGLCTMYIVVIGFFRH